MELKHYNVTDKIFYIDVVARELKKLFSNDKFNEKRYYDWLDLKLKLLDVRNLQSLLVESSRDFEKLSGQEKMPVYSLRNIKISGNIRVIFSTYDLDGEEIIILLTAFKEKNKGDYKESIDRAKNRLKEVPALIDNALGK